MGCVRYANRTHEDGQGDEWPGPIKRLQKPASVVLDLLGSRPYDQVAASSRHGLCRS